jgi:predicted amidophosphoribosyltransferase
MLRHLAAVLVPPACLACGRPPPDPDAPLCTGCAARLPWLGRACPRCALPRCGPCPAAGAAFAAAWSPMAMAGPARALVHALKFDGLLRAAGPMAAQVAATAPRWALAADGRVLVPVPAHPWRRRGRGVDHAGVLARALAERTGLPVVDALHRRRSGGRQAGAGRRARRSALAGAVEPRGEAPAVAVLVDDVHTTGATLDACARALRGAGTRQVIAVAYARALSL